MNITSPLSAAPTPETLKAFMQEVEQAHVPMTLGQLIAERAKTHPETVAINVFERGEQATYHEVEARSNVYASALMKFGVAFGDRVAVMLPNRIEFPLIWFALAKIGAVMVPVNVKYTPRETHYVLQDTGARFAIIDESVWTTFSAMELLPETLEKTRVIVVGEPAEPELARLDEIALSGEPVPPAVDVPIESLVNIQYTSGTTGFPKGCIITHEYWSVASHVFASMDERPYSRMLTWAPFLYVDAQIQIMRAFRHGGTYYLVSTMSASRFVGWLEAHAIEWCAFPLLVMQTPAAAAPPKLALEKVHMQGGWGAEANAAFVEKFGALGHNNYGMTELAWATLTPYFVTASDGSFGVEAPFRELKIVDEDGCEVAVGQEGELLVRGRGIFRGYWNRPEAKADNFVGDWFKTGDLFRQDENGFYWLLGRKKEMIRRGGENIAAREVEAVIREVAGIEDVAALPVADPVRGEEVRLFIETKSGIEPTEALATRVEAHARRHLAAFKVPRYVTFVARLPRTISSNKVMKHELAALALDATPTFDLQTRKWLGNSAVA